MRLAILALLLASFLPAQEFLHYKFDSGCTTEVINYATGPAALLQTGTLDTSNPAGSWVPGVFGTALAGGSASAHHRVRTGWDPSLAPLSGDLTIAWFMKLATAHGTSLNYINGTSPGPNRLFVYGIAGRGLYQRNILAAGGNGINSSIPNDFYLPETTSDIVTMATAGWVHVAIVVDATAQTADWYVNGLSVLRLTGIVGGAQIDSAGEFYIGGRGSSTCYYDIDEYLISRRAFLPPEILALSRMPRAGDGRYLSGLTGQCGSAALNTSGGRPCTGNAAFGLVLDSTLAGAYVLALGTTRCAAFKGAFPLPLDLAGLGPIGIGCRLLADPVLVLGGAATGAPVGIPMPIPNLAELRGQSLYFQALVFSATAMEATPGRALGFGF